jgi:2'-5' RNA ligase
MAMVRTFVAIELDNQFMQALTTIQASLQQGEAKRAGRWVRPEGIHLTLKFLGDVPSDKLEHIYQAISHACAASAPFSLTLETPGCFPNLRRPRVIWVGVREASGELAALQQAVERELGRLGYRPEERGFTPHLTLARVREEAKRGEIEALSRLIAEAQTRDATEADRPVMRVETVSVMKSDLQPSGAVYTEMFRASLGSSQGD